MLDKLAETDAERLDEGADGATPEAGPIAGPSEPTADGGDASGAPAPSDAEAPSSAGPNPFLVVGVALAAGILLARWIAWKGHVHRRT